MQNVADGCDEMSTGTMSKTSKRGLKGRKRMSKSKTGWKDFDNKTLKHLGKQLAENKTGYKFGMQYDFREFFWERECNAIVSRALDLSGENKDLVPLNKPVADGEGSKGSDTKEYSENDKK